MGEIADQIFDEVLDDEVNGAVCPLHNVFYNSRYTYCWMCEDGVNSEVSDGI